MASGSRTLRDRILETGLGVLVAAAAWRPTSMLAHHGIDNSWIVGLYVARAEGMDWGRDITFTYGPLGFLEHPRIAYPWLNLAAVIVNVVALTAIAVAMSRAWRRIVHPAFAWLLTYVVMAVVTWRVEVYVVAAIALLMETASRRGRVGGSPRLAFLVALVAPAVLLVKFSVAPLVLGLVAGFGLVAVGWRPRRLAAMGAAMLVVTIGAWLLLGQGLDTLVPFGRSGITLIGGYSQAMAFSDPDRGWEIPAAVLLGIAVVALTAVVRRRRGGRLALIDLGLVALAVLASLRIGFVRQDLQHAATFYSAILLLVAARPLTGVASTLGENRAALKAGSIVAAVVVLGAASGVGVADVLEGPGRALALPGDVQDGWDDQERFRTLLATHLGVGAPLALMARVGTESVHVDPWDTGLVWAGSLNWRPAPTFQNYAAYTPSLDRANAEFVEERGPRFILRRSDSAIDYRNPLWESPEYQLAVACRYREVGTEGEWELLERLVSDRCGAPRSHLVVEDAEDAVAVPRRGNALILLETDCRPTLVERLRAILFKPEHQMRARLGGRVFSVVPAHLSSPLLVRAGDAAVDSIKLVGCASPPRMEFFSVAIDQGVPTVGESLADAEG